MPRSRRPHAGPVLALLAFAQFISAIDYNIVYVALPAIGRELGFTPQTLQWVVSAYAVAFGGFLLLGGRAADILGRRRVFALALALYGVASLAGGLAASPGPMVAARAVQGLGGALLLPATLSLINTMFAEGPARSRALAVWGGAGGAGLALGSLLGGVLTSAFGWASVFFVNVPLALAAVVAAFALLPADARAARGRFDLPGALTATLGSTSLVFALVQGPEAGWASGLIAGAFLAGIAFLGLFVLVEARSAEPLMPLALFANRSLTAAMAITFIFMGTFGAQYYILTVHLQELKGYGALATGLAFLPGGLIGLVGTKVSERLLIRWGTRATLLTGMTLGAAGMAVFALGVSPQAGYASLLPGLLMIGLGQGIGWTAMFVAASTGVAPERQGIASAMASTTQQIGSAVGLAVLVAVINGGAAGAPSAGGLRLAGLIAAALTLAGAAVALTLRGPRPAPAVPGDLAAAGARD
ncbi:MFS transporter [Bailinhaonella thermotolerans]|uniref:MFS transporter n=1 Tax=Bailinhaonella thermotolerans TaxID=1070861 RepID=A0A3A4AF16_9ACTN|nr:MFS transporter [Bailinhaonella thermotolerans]RJL27091.1 MFS transporter [Bailinhaonella thermotolerans]